MFVTTRDVGGSSLSIRCKQTHTLAVGDGDNLRAIRLSEDGDRLAKQRDRDARERGCYRRVSDLVECQNGVELASGRCL